MQRRWKLMAGVLVVSSLLANSLVVLAREIEPGDDRQGARPVAVRHSQFPGERESVLRFLAVDDRVGGREVEPGDDRGGMGEIEPGDDRGGVGEVEPGDDRGGPAEPQPGDDRIGRNSGSAMMGQDDQSRSASVTAQSNSLPAPTLSIGPADDKGGQGQPQPGDDRGGGRHGDDGGGHH